MRKTSALRRDPPERSHAVPKCRQEAIVTAEISSGLQVHIWWGAGLPPPAPSEDEDDKETEQQQRGGSQQEQRQQRKEQAKRRKKRKEKRQKAAKELSPYCTVAAGTSAAVSRPASGGRDAQWRESFMLYIR